MTAGRAATWASIFVIPGVLWGVLNSARNDLVARTRSLVRQVQRCEPHDELAQSSFFIKSRFPEDSPDRLEEVLGPLWHVLRRCDAEGATHTGEEYRERADDGKQYTVRLIKLPSRTPSGRLTYLVIEWMRYRGSWYIHDYSFSSRA